MARNTAVNLDISNLSVGFTIGGGTTKRFLTVNGAGDTTLTAQQTIVLTLPNRATDTVVGYGDYSAKGVILVGTGAGTFTALSVGTNNFVLTADSGQTSGVKWAAAGTAFAWDNITDESADTNMSSNNGYLSNDPANSGNFVLPASSSIGDILEITNLQASQNFTITQASGQSIQFGNVSTTVGVGGSITSTSIGDSLRMVCTAANTTWQVLSVQGSLEYV
jgi:hypothetical protein